MSEAAAKQVQRQAQEHFGIAARVPDADLAGAADEAQMQKFAEAEPATPSGRSGPNQAARQRLAISGAMVRRPRGAAKGRQFRLGMDDFERIEGLVTKFPAHPASPYRVASKKRVSALRSRVIQLPMDRLGHERSRWGREFAAWMKPARPDRKNRFQKKIRRK